MSLTFPSLYVGLFKGMHWRLDNILVFISETHKPAVILIESIRIVESGTVIRK